MDIRKDILETKVSGQVVNGKRLKHNFLPSHHDIKKETKSNMLDER